MLSLMNGASGHELAKPMSLIPHEPSISQSPRQVWRWRVLLLLSGIAFTIALMACGGGPPCTGLALCFPGDLSVPTDMAGGADGGG